MGIFRPISRSSFDGAKPAPGNPNPSNWKLLDSVKIGKALIVKIQYPDATNYEGIKILVFYDVRIETLLNQKQIDPHFSESPVWKSPIARFVPTPTGWKMARLFAEALEL